MDRDIPEEFTTITSLICDLHDSVARVENALLLPESASNPVEPPVGKINNAVFGLQYLNERVLRINEFVSRI